MKVTDMKAKVASAYAGPRWRMRIDALDPENPRDRRQIIAMYRSMLESGRFDELARKKKQKDDGIQLNIWDFLKEEKGTCDE